MTLYWFDQNNRISITQCHLNRTSERKRFGNVGVDKVGHLHIVFGMTVKGLTARLCNFDNISPCGGSYS